MSIQGKPANLRREQAKAKAKKDGPGYLFLEHNPVTGEIRTRTCAVEDLSRDDRAHLVWDAMAERSDLIKAREVLAKREGHNKSLIGALGLAIAEREVAVRSVVVNFSDETFDALSWVQTTAIAAALVASGERGRAEHFETVAAEERVTPEHRAAILAKAASERAFGAQIEAVGERNKDVFTRFVMDESYNIGVFVGDDGAVELRMNVAEGRHEPVEA